MSPTLLALSRASLELTLVQSRLLARADAPATSKAERDEIALDLPVIAQRKRDTDRLINALRADEGAFPLPDEATLTSLRRATKDLADAIATDHQTSAMIDLALAVGGLVAGLESA